MAPDEKPYRVYRGGRAKGKVPAPARRSRVRGGDGRGSYRGPSARRGSGRRVGFVRRVRWRVWIPIALATIVVLLLVWGFATYLAVSGGVDEANKRLPKSARALLVRQDGLLTSHATTILVLGTDNALLPGRNTDHHSDSIMLVRTDPDHHRIAYLSIPRDLRVPVRGLGDTKINAAMQAGGPQLALQTIRDYTGLPINHVVLVDFADFKDLIDALGGVTVDIPKPIVSNRFDCPYPTEVRCQEWRGWRFAKGKHELSGRQALVYSRIRENRLDPGENDLTRTSRQQSVIQGVMSKFTSPGTLVKLPFKGGDVVKPLTTDLTAWQLIELGWVKFRSDAGASLHCRLGGDSTGYNTDIIPAEENRNVLSMFTGQSAPQPPRPATAGSPYPPGCAVGHEIG
jgi:LCP family protein required for cell wall assembly